MVADAPRHAQHDPALAAVIRRTQVTGLLKHELTHSLMFQRAGSPKADPRDRIPFWFREGMAGVTAGEKAQWPPPESLSQWLVRHPSVDLLRDGAQLARTEPGIAYGAAYHAFDFLDRRYGDATVLQILDGMRVGKDSRTRSVTWWASASSRSRPISGAIWVGEASCHPHLCHVDECFM